ncbi:hypothetical protein AQUCO_00100891v1 [Aquilegia coerulea]|uniref:PLAT domain-containing protein n=1 Tax=Aquilegia coerulea TaxID=218851 RepID=A0A2G5FCF9_AQUCA|nr:hypothetical protein AQUCO_00100891v1 [Aquilegia coerulea]
MEQINQPLVLKSPRQLLLDHYYTRKMVKSIPFLLLFFFFSEANSIIQQQPKPKPKELIGSLIKIQNNSNVNNACSTYYTVTIKTSCSSTSFTRDQISLAFGDAYGNQVYAKRIDDPSSRTFERCSTDTFQIYGPCMYGKICHLYLLRMGSDGWKPDSVKIYDRNTGTVKFNYNTFVPYGVWFGFDFCNTIHHNIKVSVV